MFEQRQFKFLQDFLKREGGIIIDDSKEYLADARLAPIARAEGIADVNQLIEQLRRPNPKLHRDVLDAMTVNETSFFRDPGVWTALRTTVLPAMLERKQDRRHVRIWSAASSSGQEPLSLAMTLLDILGAEASRWKIDIVATDLSTQMVQRTKDATYNRFEATRGLDPGLRQKYFEQHGDEWTARPVLRDLVTARVLNLNSSVWSLRGSFDLILVRNVLIYFDAASKFTILERCVPLLGPGAQLIVGASEGTTGIPPALLPERLPGLMTYSVATDTVAASSIGTPARTRSAAPPRAPVRTERSPAAARTYIPPKQPLPSEALDRLRANRKEQLSHEHSRR